MSKEERILRKLENNEHLMKVLKNYIELQVENIKQLAMVQTSLNDIKDKYPYNKFDISFAAGLDITSRHEQCSISYAIYINTDREYFSWNEPNSIKLKDIIDYLIETFISQFKTNLPIELKFLLNHDLLKFYNNYGYSSWLDKTSLLNKYIIKINETYPELLCYLTGLNNEKYSDSLSYLFKSNSDVDICINDYNILKSTEFKEFIIKLNHEFRDTLGLYTGIRLGYSKEFDLTNTIKI